MWLIDLHRMELGVTMLNFSEQGLGIKLSRLIGPNHSCGLWNEGSPKMDLLLTR